MNHKVCPHCQQPAVLTMDVCRRCGYRYPPQPYASVAAPDAPYVPHYPPTTGVTPAYSHAPTEQTSFQSPSRSNRHLYLIATLLCVVFVMSVLVLSVRHRPGSSTGLFLIDSGNGNGLVQVPAVDDQQMARRLLQAGATTGGEVEVSLAWNTLSDLDIQVRDPYGELITASNPRSAHNGVQDVDANPTPTTMEGQMRALEGKNPGIENVLPVPLVDFGDQGGFPDGFGNTPLPSDGGKAPSLYTHRPVEHIYFSQAPKGIYTVYAHCYMWREPTRSPLPFTIQVRSHGKVFHEYTGILRPGSYITTNAPPIKVCEFEVR